MGGLHHKTEEERIPEKFVNGESHDTRSGRKKTNKKMYVVQTDASQIL